MAKILLVEDDKALREIYGVRLLAEGYDIVSAGDGEEALAVAIREKPDLIISDVMMPKISGFEMLDLLRNNDATKSIKVIMMTALSGDQHRERGHNLGADRYLVKSQVGIEDVVNIVHEVLGDRAGVAAPSGSDTTGPAETPTIDSTGTTPTPATPLPAPNQSPVNPPAVTMPDVAAGVPAPTLPAAPPNIPVVTMLDTPAATTPTMPATPTLPPPVSPPDLPPVAERTPVAAPDPVPSQPPVDSVPSFQPKDASADDDDDDDNPAIPNQPSVDLTQSGSSAIARVIQPTGEGVTPKVDVANLIANEEAKEIIGQPVSSLGSPLPATPTAAPPAAPPTTPPETSTAGDMAVLTTRGGMSKATE